MRGNFYSAKNLLFLAILLFILLFGVSLSTFAISGQLFQITNNNTKDGSPLINGNKIVWINFDGNDNEIFYFDGNNIIQLTNNNNEDWVTDIDESGIVWHGTIPKIGYGNVYQIFFFRFSDNQIIQLTDGTDSNAFPSISDGQIVWIGGGVKFFDGNNIIKLSDFIDGGTKPDIHNGKVVWAGLGQKIFIYDDNSKITSSLSPSKFSSEGEPKIFDGKIVWHGYDGHDKEIFYYNGNEVIQLTNNDFNDIFPIIKDGLIVWTEFDGNDYEIFSYKNGVTKQITNNTISDGLPDIFENYIVWQGDNSFPKVFLYDGQQISQLTSSRMAFSPRIYQDKIVWTEFDGRDHEIVLFSIQLDTIPPDTTIISAIDGNSNPLVNNGSTFSASITFVFGGTDNVSVSNFECGLDSLIFTTCVNPKTYTDISIGHHTFQVRAKDTSGNIDPTPASFSWGIINPPLLLLPGILGSWTRDYDQLLQNSDPVDPRDLVLSEDQPSLLRPVPERWDSLIPETWKLLRELLEANEGGAYQYGETLFDAPYDWRRSNDFNRDTLGDIDLSQTYVRYPLAGWDSSENISLIDTAPEYLMYWIDWAKQTSRSDEVDIVAHSMGGLVARAYIESPLYQNDIRKLALVGTPNHGAADSYFLWAQGDAWKGQGFGGYFFDRWIDQMFSSFGNALSRIDFVHHFLPSVGHLLPVAGFSTEDDNLNGAFDAGEDKNANGAIDDYPGYLRIPAIFEPFFDTLIPYASLFSANKNHFLESLNNSVADLASKGVNFLLFGSTNEFVTKYIDISSNPLNPWPDSNPTRALREARSEGDGTVLLSSVSLPEIDPSRDKLVRKEDLTHSYLPSDFRSEIVNFLKNIALAPLVAEPVNQADRVLDIAIASPVDILLIDPLGRRLGYDRLTNTEFYEIPLSWYTGNVEEEQLAITNPMNGHYRVLLQGNGEGVFNTWGSVLCAEDTDDSFVQKNSGVTHLNQITEFILDVQDGCVKNSFVYALPATINLEPDTLNLKSRGNYVKAEIQLPMPYDVTDIDIATIKINDQVPALLFPVEIEEEDGLKTLEVKFIRNEVQKLLVLGDNVVKVSGNLIGGTRFEGSDTIKAIEEK